VQTYGVKKRQSKFSISFFLLTEEIKLYRVGKPLDTLRLLYRAFQNVLRDYKLLWQENTKRLCRTLHAVVFDVDSSLAAVPSISSDCAENWPEPVQRHLSAVNGRPFSHYIHSHRLAAEMWTTIKNNLQGKQFLSCSFYLYRFRKNVSYGFPVINFCNPGVHYEKPCIDFFIKISYFCLMLFLYYLLHGAESFLRS
jgi:hypothetical protein